MNRKSLIRKTALSAFALLAVAGQSAFADSGTGPTSGTTKSASSVQSLQAAPVQAAFRIADPLKLAEQYAPGTLDDWKKTLAEYRKLTGLTSTSGTASFSTDSDAGTAAGTVSLNPGIFKVSTTGAVSFSSNMQPVTLEDAGSLTVKQLKPADTSFAVDGSKLETFTAGKAVAVPAGSLPAGITDPVIAGHAETITLTAASAGEADDIRLTASSRPLDAYTLGTIELSKAAESQDADAIRKALADQLNALKHRIAELRADAVRAE